MRIRTTARTRKEDSWCQFKPYRRDSSLRGAAVLILGIIATTSCPSVSSSAVVAMAVTEQVPFKVEADDEVDIQRASDWLQSLGVTGLCHPTSNRYAPVFPFCGDEDTNNSSGPIRPSTSSSRYHRQLEQGNTYHDYYSYQAENQNDGEDGSSGPKTWGDSLFDFFMVFLCVTLGALASGLTVGLLSLDPLLLVIKMRAGQTLEERQQAAELLPLVKQHHLLLVTLVLLNTVAGEALPVFLQAMVPDSVAVVLSVILVLVVGEIGPTALFTGPNQIFIASRLAPSVKVLMFLMWPIAYPIAKLLDRIMHGDDEGMGEGDGDDGEGGCSGLSGGTLYNRGELAALIRVQYEERLVTKQRRKHQRQASLASVPDFDPSEIDPGADIRALKTGLLQHQDLPNIKNTSLVQLRSDSIDCDEVMMVEGALQMKTKTAMDIYLSFHKVFCTPYDMPLDETNIFTIYASGYSRVPVYLHNDRRRVKGILMTRQLMVVKKANSNEEGQHHLKISDLNLHVPNCVAPETNLVDLVNLFQTGGSAVRAGHMALLCARPDIANEALEQDQAVPVEAGLMGIITLEDVLEALLQEQIYDEMDAAGRMPVASEEIDTVEEEGEEMDGYQLA